MISFHDEAEIREQLRRIMNDEPAPDPIPSAYKLPELSEEGRQELYLQYTAISNNEHLRRAEKWMGLKALGISDQECEELCRAKEINREEVMMEVAALIKEERKKLKKWDRENLSLRSEANLDKHSGICGLDDSKLN